MKTGVDVYDPRHNQEYEIVNFITNRKFSSLEHGFFVVSGVDLDWRQKVELLYEAFLKTSKLGFLAVKPWYPHIETILKFLKTEYQTEQEIDKTIIAYFEISLDTYKKAFELRSRLGGDQSGEWYMGGCLEKFNMPRNYGVTKNESWDFAHLMNEPEKIGCALELSEMMQSTLITRIFVGFDNWVEGLS